MFLFRPLFPRSHGRNVTGCSRFGPRRCPGDKSETLAAEVGGLCRVKPAKNHQLCKHSHTHRKVHIHSEWICIHLALCTHRELKNWSRRPQIRGGFRAIPTILPSTIWWWSFGGHHRSNRGSRRHRRATTTNHRRTTDRPGETCLHFNEAIEKIFSFSREESRRKYHYFRAIPWQKSSVGEKVAIILREFSLRVQLHDDPNSCHNCD